MSDHDPSATRFPDSAVESWNPGDACELQERGNGGASVMAGELLGVTEELEISRRELLLLKDELASTNSDLSNLVACSTIATLFLDRSLAIRRYTPGSTALFNLTPADLGRPLVQLKHSLDYPELATDAEDVLRKLVPVERLVSDDTRRFQARLRPYRTAEDQIAGVVLTLVDMTEQLEAAEVLRLDLEATTLLSEVSMLLAPEGDLQPLLDLILDSAIVIMRADAGTVQIYDPVKETLRMPSHRGVPLHVVEHFSEVSAGSRSPCGRALESGRRVTTLFDASLPDPTGDNRWHREEAGLLSAQSTPLVARSGRVLGMLSTHWRASHFPNNRELRFFDLLTRLAADAIERQQSDDLLRRQKEELQRCHEVAAAREARVTELEGKVRELTGRLGDAPR